MTQDHAYARAFNLGSDARLGAVSLYANPYARDDCGNYKYWRAGWNFVQAYWGIDSIRPVRPLPRIGEVA